MAGDAFMCLTEGNIAPGILANFKGRPSGSTLLQDKDGLILVFHLDSPTETEINAAKKHNLMTAYYLNGPYWLGQVRSTENSIFSFDFSFNIYGYPKEEREQRRHWITSSNTIMSILIDTVDGRLCSIRYSTMPPEFHALLYLACVEQLNLGDEQFTNRYNRWRSDLYTMYSVDELWDISTKSGNFGDAPDNKEK